MSRRGEGLDEDGSVADRGTTCDGDLCSGAREQPLGGERDHPDGDRRHADLRTDRHHQFRPRRIPHAGRNRRLGSGGLRPRLRSGAAHRRRHRRPYRVPARARSVPVHAHPPEQRIHGLARPFDRAPARRHPHLELVFKEHSRTASRGLGDRRDPIHQDAGRGRGWSPPSSSRSRSSRFRAAVMALRFARASPIGRRRR